MTLMEWNDQLSVGVDMIDMDHKVLVDQINMLHDALEQGSDQGIVGSVLNVLIDYTAYHFDREQQLMQTVGYVESEAHMREHRMLVKKVKEIQAGYMAGASLGQDVMNFLKVWLTQHILKSDKAFGAAVKAAGAARVIPPPKVTGPVNWTRLNALVVDDQFNFRLLLRNVLNSIGVTMVREAKNGAEAYAMMENEFFDVILTDDEMDVMGGLELTRKIRSSKGQPDPRTLIILLPSQEISREYLQNATRAGVHDMIIKPLATNSVRARIEKHLTNPLPFHEVNGQLIPVRQPPTAGAARRPAAAAR